MNLIESSTYLQPSLRFIAFAELYILYFILFFFFFIFRSYSFQIPKSNFYPGFPTDNH